MSELVDQIGCVGMTFDIEWLSQHVSVQFELLIKEFFSEVHMPACIVAHHESTCVVFFIARGSNNKALRIH
ncbi:hypothetical protein AN403_1106 [Pseudomonas fluorescens]|uniref:Uncharacterized protein n=1 Tax=Pseudomonas fluorescens TaxID=294 RepID=A0A0P8XE05_PSEFL|nr:hypothetical protein AN403_1106 [Pseudomonas fluorescens]